MANGDDNPFDSAFGAFGDPNPPGTTTAIGATATNPNDPLIDWASNLNKDDLARFLHDPQAHIQDLAARGIPPPSEAAVQRIHDLNEQVGTPSRSDRFAVQPQAQDALSGPQPTARVNPATGRLYNLTSDINQQGSTDAARAAVGGQPRPSALGYIDPQTGFDMPGVPENPPPSQIGQKVKEFLTIPPDAPIRKAYEAKPAAPGPYVSLGASSPNPADLRFEGPLPPVAQETPSKLIPGEALAEPKEQARVGEKSDKDKVVKTKLQQADEALSDLGKAMQGVKAPPPLQPPNIGAPSVRSPQGISGGASLLHQLLTTGRAGTVPPSIMPLLHLLGRV